MNVIFTHSFLKKFKKDYRSYNFSILELAIKLKRTQYLKLEEPFHKVKLKLNNVAIRWIVLLSIKDKILPIYIVLKKDKKYWNNLIFNKKIEQLLHKLAIDIEKDLYNKNYIEL